ncbi:MAG: 4Fe-4S dicluster domain-containing protein [Deltaproteobacteria bacterium]|nr:MAG: 4Fe-4S dicluster domain-containing protein [Deltaproteobacteria bacterium]
MPFTIVAENCTGCTACEKRCPTHAISGDPKKAFFIEPALCIDCGACGVICPDEAILDTYGNVTKVLKRQERPIAIVHPDNCNGCGVCIDVCPFDCIYPSPENQAQYLGKVEVDGQEQGTENERQLPSEPADASAVRHPPPPARTAADTRADVG